MSKIILCADDSVTMQKVAEITFRATEYSYVGAQNVDDALTKARANKPALVLADASMPGKDGYDLCKAIKGDSSLAGVPVVLLCGKSQAYDSDRGSDAGADGHLTKPWDTQVMIDKVAEILAKAGSAGASAAAPSPAPAAKPAAPAAPATPKIPSIPTQSPTTARSATIMGMPSIKPPMKSPAAPGVTPIQSVPTPAPVAPPKPAAPAPAPRPAPVAVKPPAPAAPAPAPKPAAPAPAPAAAGMGRPPMISGIPTKRLKPVSAQVASKVAAAAADVAREAGLDPAGPEVQALMRLSADVIERIAWEVIPQLAEAMLRENLQDLAAKQQ